MEEIVKHINDTNASYRQPSAGDAKNTDLFLDNEHYELFKDSGEQITVRYNKENLTKAILFIASILPRKFDQSASHELIRFSKEFVLDQLAIIDALFKEGNVPTNTFTQVWNARKDVPQKNGKIDKRFYFNGLLKDVEYIDHEGIHRNTKFTIRNYFAGGYSNLHIIKSADGIFDVSIENTQEYFNDGKEDGLEEKYVAPIQSLVLQQIFYGAPGTGKSHAIKERTEGKDVIRTTFHPDTDYSTFVGAYKPTTKAFPVTTVIGTKAVAVEDEEGHKMTEDKIVYEFVPQAFLQAYVAAWQKFDKVEDLNQPKEEYLVIEEINRGNCAQIFGDLFQLLDRGDGGFSEYPIKADADMKKYLQKALKETNLEGIKADLNGMFKGEDIAKQVKDGDILLLPNNFYIWATMNTSDQSLFPIDSAFKRRWDWRYVPISDAGKQWVIRVNGNDYSWWNFLEEINNRIYQATYSEDKKLGYFFCKAKDGVIDADVFVSKVVFYLWNDVFKDMEFEGDAFKDGENGKLSFDKFYTVEGNKTKVVSDKVEVFLKNLGLEATEISTADDNTKVDTKILVNGRAIDKVNAIPYSTIEEYIRLNSEKSAHEVAEIWRDFAKYSMRSWIIATKAELDTIPERYAKYSYQIECADGQSVWVNKDGWMHHPKNTALRDTIKEFIDAVNASGLGVKITENND